MNDDDDAERMKMGENDEQQRNSAEENRVRIAKELPVIFGDFTIQETWNTFFAVRGGDDSYTEWYADYPLLQNFFRNNLSSPPPPEELSILVPGCGYSRLSEHLYDDGFVNITNVDFSKLVISAMLKRNLKERPQMKWRVMDMTDMQFENGTFNAIIDKGALDALMELELGPRQGILYLSEVKRLLKAGGKYIYLTSAESHVLGLLFPKFRFGWKVSLYAFSQEPSSGTTKQLTLMLVAEKYILTIVSQIKSFTDENSVDFHDNQVQELIEAVKRENNVRAEYFNGTSKWYSLEELKQGVEGNLGVLEPGRAIRLFLGEPGVSRFFCNAVLLDGHPTTEPFSDQFLLLFCQRMQIFQRILVSEHRPSLILASSKAARLLMVLLDSSHSGVSTGVVLKDIYDFLNQLNPVDNSDDIVVTPGNQFKQQKIVYEVTSALTGRIVVDEVIYNCPPSDVPKKHDQSKDPIFLRLLFERTETFARSEALTYTKGPNRIASELERKNVPTSSRNLKRGKLRKFDSQSSDSPASSGDWKIDYKYLVSDFYKGMISGILLFSIHAKRTSAAGGLVKTVIIGLGAGLLPMSIRNYIPSLKIEVIELDPVVLNVAKEYFGFEENEHLKVHITDATKFVRDRANSEAEGNDSSKVDVLIVDVDSSDSSSGLISPEAEIFEEPFLLAAKDSLSDKGLFLVKLVTGFPGVRDAVYSKLTTVFTNLFYIDLDTNICGLILALKKDSPVVGEKELAEACAALEESLENKNKDWVKRALDDSKLIKPIRHKIQQSEPHKSPLKTPTTAFHTETHTHTDPSATEMGRKKKQHAVGNGGSAGEKNQNQEELLKTLGDFTSKENWDQFFTIRGADDSFEWYAEWPQLRNVLTAQLLLPSSVRKPESAGVAPPAVKAEELSILVPGCGNSKLSEHLYDAGFLSITNVDFSKVVISDMLRRNLRERPQMKWRVMDMTNMQFAEETFDAIVDKGGLDALMEPEIGSGLGNKYISEVRRLLKYGGKYICLTLAESHVLALLFSKFRFGWKMSLYTIAKGPSSRNVELQTFMVVVEKDTSISVSEISSFMDEYSVESHGNQARELYEALEREQKVRSEYSNGCDIVYSLEDLNLGANGNLAELEPGRRLKLILGEPGVSRHFYNAVLFDAKKDSAPFSYHYAAFIVPKIRVDDWMFSSKEGQWLIVSSSKASRLLMILLDSSNSNAAMQDIQIDLSPLVKQLAPRACGEGVPIPFMAASDGIMEQQIVKEVTSALTGPIIVDDVVYHSAEDYADDLKSDPSKFRRLTFQRSQSLVQSEALLSKEGSDAISCETEKGDVQIASRTRKKGKQGKFDPYSSASHGAASNGEMKVDHNYLASSYHNGIISGLMLISLHLQGSSSARGMVKTAVIGLGAGLLPMFMKNCLPTLNIEVVELDPVVLDVAKEYFDFREDERLQVHITDGIKFVREKADASAEGESSCKLDILIVDVDSPDSSSGLTCPAEDFVEESFLLTAKNSLSEEGLFIINLVSRSSAVKSAVYSRLKTVFGNLYSLKLEEDVNEVIFALKKDSPVTEGELSKACDELERSLELEKHKWCRKVIDASKLIKPLT